MNEFNFRDFLNYIILLKQNINWVNFLDLFFVVLIIFFFLYFFKKIHVHRVVLGFLISFSLIYFLSFWLKFYTVLSIVNFLLGFLLIIFVILFQKELRRFIHILDIKYLKKEILKKRNSFYLKDDFLKKLTETVFELAKNKIGALIVLKRKDDLNEYLESGFELFGKFSKPLILSIFDPNSVGHDGAVVIDNGIVEKFGVILPLSENNKLDLKNLGTRHRAGLGLSEKTDAISLIVSEEKGSVALCENGYIIFFQNQEELLYTLNQFFSFKKNNFKNIFYSIFNFIKNYILIFLFSFIVGLVFWGVNNISHFNFIYQTIEAPIVFNKMPEKAIIEKLSNNYIELTFLGTEKDFKLLNKDSFKVLIDFSDLKINDKDQNVEINIKPEFIKYPNVLKLIKFKPTKIEFKLNFE